MAKDETAPEFGGQQCIRYGHPNSRSSRHRPSMKFQRFPTSPLKHEWFHKNVIPDREGRSAPTKSGPPNLWWHPKQARFAVISRQQKVSIVCFANPGHCRCANSDGRTIPRSRNPVPGLCLVIHPGQTADVSLHREGSFTIRFGSSNGKQSKRRTGVQNPHKCACGQTLFGRMASSKQMAIRFLSNALRPSSLRIWIIDGRCDPVTDSVPRASRFLSNPNAFVPLIVEAWL